MKKVFISVLNNVLVLLVVAQEVSVQPDSCICPTESYWCRADLVTVIAVQNSNLSEEFTYVVDVSFNQQIMGDGLEVLFSEQRVGRGPANLTAQMFIIDIQTWNGSNFICRISGGNNKNFSICITGKQV